MKMKYFTVFILSSIFLAVPALADTKTIQFQTGWNMFSLPVDAVVDVSAISGACQVGSYVWTYNSSKNYQKVSIMAPNIGYWVKMKAPCSVTINGGAISTTNSMQTTGWNQIGSLTTQTDLESIKGNCSITSGPSIYNSSTGSYNTTSFIEPGKSYWIRVAGNCNLGSSSRLVAYWKFDESSGTIAADSSSNGNILTLSDLNNISWAGGHFGNAIKISDSLTESCGQTGTDIKATMKPSLSSILSGPFTFSAWINTGSYYARTILHINSQYTTPGCCDGLWFGKEGNALMTYFANSSNIGSSLTANYAFLPNTWYFVTFVLNSTAQSIYVNGNLIGSTKVYGSFGNAAGLHIGIYEPSCTDSFRGGMIDEVKIWNRSLSASEIMAEYQGSTTTCSDGTSYGQCSANKPMYCSSGTLINKCSQCGCSSGTCQADGTCKITTSCAQMAYPLDRWQRVWYIQSTGACLGNGPDQTSVEFDDNWGTGNLEYGTADDIEFTSSRKIYISATGTYTFTVGSDDGVALWIDGNVVLDRWYDRSYTTDSVDVYLTAGNHDFRLDFYENGGDARVYFSYSQIVSQPDAVAYWRFDESSGTIADDSSSNFNSGVVVNTGSCSLAAENSQITVSCPAGGVISSVESSVYVDGSSPASCSNPDPSGYAYRYCDYANSCLDQSICSFYASNTNCGGDPLFGFTKNLILKVDCTNSGWVGGKSGNALSFDGVDDYVEILHPAGDLAGPLTFAAWIYPRGDGILINKENSWEVAVVGGIIQWAFNNVNPGWAWISTGYAAPLNQWTHIAVVYDSSANQVRSYANGALVSTVSISGSIATTADNLRIGARTAFSQYFNGMMDEVKVWDKALSASEVQSEYGGIPQTCSCTGWSSGSCGAGSCSSTQRQYTRTCTPSGCTASDGYGSTKCISDASCTGSGTTMTNGIWILAGEEANASMMSFYKAHGIDYVYIQFGYWKSDGTIGRESGYWIDAKGVRHDYSFPSDSDISTAVSNAHAAGLEIYPWITAQTSYPSTINIGIPSVRQTAINNMVNVVSVINGFGFDGISDDIEELDYNSYSDFIAYFNDATTAMHGIGKKYFAVILPYLATGMGPANFNQINVDRISPMLYGYPYYPYTTSNPTWTLEYIKGVFQGHVDYILRNAASPVAIAERANAFQVYQPFSDSLSWTDEQFNAGTPKTHVAGFEIFWQLNMDTTQWNVWDSWSTKD
ncbi:MAG: LamG-like jellyroll fold domain-containing protein [Candidatus Aenigmatarchaeota archaeon]